MNHQIGQRQITTDRGMPVFQAFPLDDADLSCFVVLHERYGLVQHTMDLATRIAGLGHAVVAPNLYWQYEDQEGLRAGTASTKIRDRDAIESIDDALQSFNSITAADPTRLGLLGACATGRYPIVWGANRHLDVAVVLHGLYANREWTFDPDYHEEEMHEMLRRLDSAFLGQFGELDNLISVDDVRFIRNQFEDVGQSYEITLYQGAPHGWMNSTMPGRFRPEIAELSFAELAGFLGDHLRSPKPRDSEISWRYHATFARDYDFSQNKRLA